MKITQVTCPCCCGLGKASGRDCAECFGTGLIAWDENGQMLSARARDTRAKPYGRNYKHMPEQYSWTGGDA